MTTTHPLAFCDESIRQMRIGTVVRLIQNWTPHIYIEDRGLADYVHNLLEDVIHSNRDFTPHEEHDLRRCLTALRDTSATAESLCC
jgi:hypothetical protein